MKFRTIPNIITVARIILVWPFLGYLISGHYRVAFYLFMAAGLSDGIDGFLARRFNWTSYFGSFVDPLADKLLLMSSFVALASMGQFPLWLMLLVIARDVVIMAGVGVWFQVCGELNFEPTKLSKFNTALQVALIFFLLFELAYWPLPVLFMQTLIIVIAITTVLTLLNYVWVYGRRAYYYEKRIGQKNDNRT